MAIEGWTQNTEGTIESWTKGMVGDSSGPFDADVFDSGVFDVGEELWAGGAEGNVEVWTKKTEGS